MPLLFQLIFLVILLKFRADAAEADRMALHSKDVLAHATGVRIRELPLTPLR